MPAAEIRALLERLRVRPVITAHPTEAKRVTVLEKHRRIYRRLVDLESPRWTPRERQALIDGLRNEIELLWLTGELRLQKPTVPQEVFWGLHFFNETLFEAVPDLLDKLERVLAQYYPDERLGRRRSSSSAPGSAATATAIRSSPTTSPAARCWRIGSPASGATAGGSTSWCAALSITEKAVPLSDRFRAGARPGARGDAARRGDRQPEPGRGVPPVSRRACCAGSR